MIKININQYVYIIPKESDFITMKEKDDKYLPEKFKRSIEEYKKKIRNDGKLEIQIHQFIYYFGDKSYVGNLLPGDGNMYFNEKDLITE